VYLRARYYERTLRWLKTLALVYRDKTLPQSQCGKAITYLHQPMGNAGRAC
jgi:hypothetical protein